jgi:hypothetical protein
MLTNAERAEQAIEAYLRRYRPKELELIWRERKPKTHWGIAKTAWRDRASAMIARFNALDVTGPQIDRTDDGVRNALKYFHDRPLGGFEQYMIDKADGSNVAAAESNVGEGGQ